MQLTDRQLRLLNNTFIDYHATSEFMNHPLVVDRADGLYYWDTDGKRYFDAIGGIFVAVLGHRHPRVMKAMTDQMAKVTFAPPLIAITEIMLDFVERLGDVSPGNLRFVKPYSGGSEAVESALKFTRQYFKQTGRPSKYKFISRYYAYHGGTFGGMAASGNGPRKSKFEPQMGGFLKVFPPSYYRDRFPTWEEANRFAAYSIEDVILHEDPSTVAAVLVEPIGNTGGIITPTEEYFRIVREICNRHDVLLIFDEVITGFAKTGSMFAAQTFGVTPDILCAGKGISSGAVPLGAMIAREDMAAAFRGAPDDAVHFAHGHTFAGNPLACAVGMAVIEEIVEKDLCGKALVLGNYLRERLLCLKKYGVIREVRGKGTLLGVELVEDTHSMKPFPALGRALKIAALENGLVMRVDPTWFAIAPPLIAEKADIDEMCELIEPQSANGVKEAWARVKPTKLCDWLLLIACNLMWASQFVMVKLVQEQMGPLFAVAFPIGLSTLLLVFLVHREAKTDINKSDIRNFILLGILGQLVAQLFITWGIRFAPASNAALITLIMPVSTAVMAHFFLGEVMTRVRWISFGLALLGVLACSGVDWNGLSFGKTYALGNALILLSVLGSAFYNAYTKKALERHSPLKVLLYSYYVLLIVLLPLTVIVEPSGFANLFHYSGTVWFGLAVLAIFQYFLSMVIFLNVLTRLDATQAALSNYLIPFFGVLIAAVVLHERLTGFMIAGGLLALASTLLITVWDDAPQPETSPLAVTGTKTL